jgi:hypothetical protein
MMLDADHDPRDGRDETEGERLDRNWNDILQELRVTQTGTQILVGFLLTLAFQPRFAELDRFQVVVYLVIVVLAVLATALALTPVSVHRVLFRRGAKPQLVRFADGALRACLAAIALLLAGTVLLIFDVVLGRAVGVAAGAAALVLTGLAWIALPIGLRRRGG